MSDLQHISELLASIDDRLSLIESQLQPPKSRRLGTREAAIALGCTPEALRDRIRKKLYRIGVEVFDKRSPGSRNRSYLFDIEACRKREEVPPERRKG